MENFFVRYKNPLVLMAVVVIQVIALATQVKRPEGAKGGTTGSGTRLIRVWTITTFTPVAKMFISTGHFFRDGWHNYADLRGVRRKNRELQDELARLQMEQVRLKQDADQARRLQVLLDFKEKFVSRTVAAQVIATSGIEQSRVIIIDKGSHDGLKTDMAVITPDGIIGKVKEVGPISSQVLLINDHDSGAGVILEHSRLQGIVKGTSIGELQITDIMSDEQIEAGDHVITSGGDRIYPKGFSVGTVVSATPDRDNDPFLAIKIKPSADLRRLEEVLVITKTVDENSPVAAGPAPMRAADILAQRLPSVPKQDPNAVKTPGGAPNSSTANVSVPNGSSLTGPSPGSNPPGKKPVTPTPGGTNPTGTPVGPPKATPSPTPVKTNQPVSTEAGQKPANAPGPPKHPAPATAGGVATQLPPKKTGPAAGKPATSLQTAAPTGTNGAASPSPTPVKPKAVPKKSNASAPPGTSQPSTSGEPADGPAATPTPTPERTRQ
ncbi:MAG TPA: rod shape-determining protein MreC [Candidatus Angelobacter sp.]|nr:rod shape-determining protein MreC [Candidatus Angelobacter sp.]